MELKSRCPQAVSPGNPRGESIAIFSSSWGPPASAGLTAPSSASRASRRATSNHPPHPTLLPPSKENPCDDIGPPCPQDDVPISRPAMSPTPKVPFAVERNTPLVLGTRCGVGRGRDSTPRRGPWVWVTTEDAGHQRPLRPQRGHQAPVGSTAGGCGWGQKGKEGDGREGGERATPARERQSLTPRNFPRTQD